MLLLHLPLPLLDHTYTMLVPTNEAFERLATQQLGLNSVEQLLAPEHKDFLTAVSWTVCMCVQCPTVDIPCRCNRPASMPAGSVRVLSNRRGWH